MTGEELAAGGISADELAEGLLRMARAVQRVTYRFSDAGYRLTFREARWGIEARRISTGWPPMRGWFR